MTTNELHAKMEEAAFAPFSLHKKIRPAFLQSGSLTLCCSVYIKAPCAFCVQAPCEGNRFAGS